MTVWRLHTCTWGGDISDYCLENHVAAMGWSFYELFKEPDSAFEEKVKAIDNDYKKFLECAEEFSQKYSPYEKRKMSVPQLHNTLQSGDLIWMHTQGCYYLGNVGEESRWLFCYEARKFDAANQVTDICWHKIYDAGQAPSMLRKAFMGQAFRRVLDTDVQRLTFQKWQELFKGY